MKKTIIVFLFSELILFNAFAGEDRSFDQHSREVINVVHEVLIDSGKCSDANDCIKKQYVFFNPKFQGIDLHFYGITEEVLIQKIFAVLVQQHYRLPDDSSLHARFISSTKETDLKRSFFKSSPVFAELHMQGEKQPSKLSVGR